MPKCKTPEKASFKTEERAVQHRDEAAERTGESFTAYLCVCGSYHIKSNAKRNQRNKTRIKSIDYKIRKLKRKFNG